MVAAGMLTEDQARQMMPAAATAAAAATDGGGEADEGSDTSDEPDDAELAAAMALSLQRQPGASSAVLEQGKDAGAMRAWLRGLGLEHCHDALVEEGYDDLDTIRLLEPEDLDGTPIDSTDRAQLLAAVEALRASGGGGGEHKHGAWAW